MPRYKPLISLTGFFMTFISLSCDQSYESPLLKASHYGALGIPLEATNETIRKAYKFQALKAHPDKNHNKDTTEQFKKLNAAYAHLSDSEKKYVYDQSLAYTLIASKNTFEQQIGHELLKTTESDIPFDITTCMHSIYDLLDIFVHCCSQ